MAKESGRQKAIVGRVMHEFKHGELETHGRKVRNPRQAIAIGLSEAGASNRRSASQNRQGRARTETEERKGRTAKQMSGGNRGNAGSRARSGQPTRAQLYAEAQRRGIGGCSRMNKTELEQVLRRR